MLAHFEARGGRGSAEANQRGARSRLRVTFAGEAGADEGGLATEMPRLFFEGLVDPRLGLFESSSSVADGADGGADGSGDGGLMSIVKSPTYSQDRLMYAYISTPTDNRVIRIADGDVPKDLLTGIPKGATGNTGSLIFTSPTTLVVQTGDAGDPARANDPKSLAGKVIRIEQPTTVDQAPPTTALSGMGSGGGMCLDPADKSLYITDRTPAGDRLQRIGPDSKSTTVWTWPDRPGVAGCAALDGTVLVNLVNTKQTVALQLAQATGAVTGDPEVVRDGKHGHAWALGVGADGNIWGATVNRTAGDAEKLDDVVFPLLPQGGGFPRSNAEIT